MSNPFVYAIQQDGKLLWFRHDGQSDGTFNWQGPNEVGAGWNFKQVFSGGDGVIYALSHNGDLLWYRHDGRGDGSFTWAFNEGKKVGNGWNFKQVFSGGDGVIYALSDNGDLLWYRHDGRGDGSFTWAFNEGKKVGNGWNFKHVFSGGLDRHLAESVTLHSGSITSGLSIGGFADIFMGRGGDFTFSGHMHNGGVLGIDFLLTLVALTPSGIAFTKQRSGHTAGSLTPGSSNDNWTTPGFDERIRDNWPEASQARLTWTLHANDTLTPQLGKALEEAVQQALQAAAKAAVTALIALV